MRWTLAIALSLLACTATPPIDPDPAELQMNDLAILLPLPRTQVELDAMLALGSPGRGAAELVPHYVFDQTDFGSTYERFRAVAFRIDPCFGSTNDQTPCQPQIRIVFQPVTLGSTDDIAAHAFYTLTDDELAALVDELAAARRADGVLTDLGPLAPHPVIVREGLDGAFAREVDRIVAKYAGTTNLIRLNTLAIEEIDVSQGFVSLQAWAFSSTDAQLDPPEPRPIPAIDRSLSRMTLTTALVPLAATDDPLATTPDNIAPLAGGTSSGNGREGAFDAALRIENPHFHSPETVDCASCHIARAAIELAGADFDARGRDSAFSPSQGIPFADVAATTHLIDTDRGLNIHAFSYRGAEPMINQRTINETAANLASLASR